MQEIPGWGKKVKPSSRSAGGRSVASVPASLSAERKVFPRSAGRRRMPWGIYLVDVFDNMLLLRETPGYALLEPIPLRKTARPPVADRIDPHVRRPDLHDRHLPGPGLRGIPRGTVKQMRLVS